eukprot:CAMPEP_0115829780 /NCGR_PEP_ID=MMETSP0287-20121206/1276_1 /TAXON_ID=412157 /ORGANISM="Chrysochromulina rotalis, Strain UIO044" /LENGTH=161 /DNA_ID=CAMNT_0003283059 /DNA_START=179 /DNA_END=665 /DNA_ORIENTATION=+
MNHTPHNGSVPAEGCKEAAASWVAPPPSIPLGGAAEAKLTALLPDSLPTERKKASASLLPPPLARGGGAGGFALPPLLKRRKSSAVLLPPPPPPPPLPLPGPVLSGGAPPSDRALHAASAQEHVAGAPACVPAGETPVAKPPTAAYEASGQGASISSDGGE